MVHFVVFMPLFLKRFSFSYPCLTSKKSFSPKSMSPQPSYIQIVGHSFGVSPFFLYAQFGLLPSVEVFLYFFEAKGLGRQLWVSFNGVAGRALLSLFQQSYKGFKGKFMKIHYNKRDPTLLDGFPLYWTKKPTFQGVRCLESMSHRDHEVYHFFSSLKVVFHMTTLISQEFSQEY